MTISEEKEHTRKLRRNKYKHIDASLAFKYVRKPDERFQLLHHSYVYGFDRVALIVANNSAKVITGTVIEFSNTLHEKYGKVLEKLKNIALPWAYSDIDTALIVIPNDVIALSKQMPAINGKETLYGALKLWRKMFSDTSYLPRPVLKRIIPATHAQWNATKGGSDTVTKLVDDCFVSPPKIYTNFESVAFTRCISNLIASILKLYQTITSKDDISTAYSTIQHYRNAASHRITFKRLLRKIYRIFKAEVQKAESEKENNNGNHQQQALVSHRQRRTRVRGFTAVPEQMDFLAVSAERTFKTPTKAKKKLIDKGNVPQMILERTHKCTGYPFEVVSQKEGSGKKDPRQRCFVCKTKTQWQCVKCHFYFCMSYKKNSNRDEKLYYVKGKESKHSNQEFTKIYGKTCFHSAHETALQNTILADNNDE